MLSGQELIFCILGPMISNPKNVRCQTVLEPCLGLLGWLVSQWVGFVFLIVDWKSCLFYVTLYLSVFLVLVTMRQSEYFISCHVIEKEIHKSASQNSWAYLT